jgi:hypothetical protein
MRRATAATLVQALAWLGEALSAHLASDEHNVYVLFDERVLVLRRSVDTGALSQLPGGRGCLDLHGRAGCGRPGHLAALDGMVASPDGRGAYLVAAEQAIAAVRRDPRTGTLFPVEGRDGCVGEGSECTPLRGGLVGADNLREVAITPDGRMLLVTLGAGDRAAGIAVLRRDPATSHIKQLPGPSGCFTTPRIPGCSRLRGVSDVATVAVSPDGRSVLVGGNPGLAILARNPVGATLRQLPGAAGCLSPSGVPGCRHLRGDRGNALITFLDRGARVVLATDDSFCDDDTGECQGTRGTVVLARDPQTGAVFQPAGRAGCLLPSARHGCARLPRSGDFQSVVAGPDDRSAYIVTDGGVLVLTAREGLGLRRLRGPGGCLTMQRTRGCARVPVPFVLNSLRLSRDERSAYAISDGMILTLRRDPVTGALHVLRRRVACLTSHAVRGCIELRGPQHDTGDMLLAAGGRDAYALSTDGIAILQRAPTGG